MYVRVYVRMYACVYIHVYMHMCMYVYMHTCACVCVCVCVYLCLCIHSAGLVCTCVYMYVCVCVCATRALASRARCCDARTRERERWTRVPGAATHSFAISRVPTREARACVRRPHSDTCECSPSPASRPSPSLTRAGVCPACARYPGRAGLDVMRFRCVACVIYRLINR